MMPMEIEGNDPRGLLPDIVDDGKFMILNPLYSQVHYLSRNMMTMEKVGQSEEPHGQEIDPQETIDRPVVIGQLGDMKKNAVKGAHRANCKMTTCHISTSRTKKRIMHRA
jgi:hypothetical protein